MRKYSFVPVVAALVLVASTSSADPISAGDIVQLRLTDNSGTALTRFSNGGPFRMDLPGTTWARFLIWMAIGLLIYFAYGMRHSRLRRGQVTNPEAEL